MNRIWSSVHFFTQKQEKVIQSITAYVKDERDERSKIGTYFSSLWEAGHNDAVNWGAEYVHDHDRDFMQRFCEMYDKWVPDFVVQQDFKKRGLPLNTEGMILKCPGVVSCFASRLYGGERIKDAVYYTVQDLSKENRCPVLSHHMWIADDGYAKCKIYLSAGKQMAIAVRSSNPAENCDQNTELFMESFPHLDWPLILSAGVYDFSEGICRDLQIVEGGPGLKGVIDKDFSFIETYKLFNIYEKLG